VAFNGFFISQKNLINTKAGMRTYLELLVDLKLLQLKLKTSWFLTPTSNKKLKRFDASPVWYAMRYRGRLRFILPAIYSVKLKNAAS
jgi:hypothetical protein